MFPVMQSQLSTCIENGEKKSRVNQNDKKENSGGHNNIFSAYPCAWFAASSDLASDMASLIEASVCAFSASASLSLSERS